MTFLTQNEMKNVTTFLNKTDFSKLLDDVNIPQTRRCKINTGYICNSKCCFCYFFSRRHSYNYSLETIKKQLDIAKKFGMDSVDFSGGESSIHPDFLLMIKYAKTLNFRNICCITNGSSFCYLDYIQKCVSEGLNDILFSLHGTEKIHEKVTRIDGSFKKVKKSIENSHKCGIKPRINTVIVKNNFRNIVKLANEIKNYDIYQWNIIIYKMQYECGDISTDNFISHKKTSNFIKQAIDITKKYIPQINVRYIPFCFMEGYEQYVTNYNQKKYDQFEWSNYMLRMFEQDENCIKIPNINEVKKLDKLNDEAVKQNKKDYVKASNCRSCKNILICDGFEKKYSKFTNINNEATCQKGSIIKNPLYYRNKNEN